MSLLARLIEAGTPPELIGEVAMLLAEKKLSDAAIEDRRAKDRERQGRKRSRDVTECHVTWCDNQTGGLSRPPNENISNPPTHTPPDMYIPREAFPMLDCTDPQTWADFRQNRKTKRLPCTATAHAKLIADLEKWSNRTGWPPGKVFSACVAKGWGAIYDPTESDDGRNQQRPKANGGNHVAPNGRSMGRTEAAARALAGMAGPGEPYGGSAGLVTVPDTLRTIGNVG